MMEMDPVPSSDDCTQLRNPPVDPNLRRASDELFVSVRSETYRCVRVKETDMLAVPWGPRVDVMFDPKGAPGIVGGTIRVMARTSGTEVEIGNVPITSATTPIAISVATACDEYVVKALLGSSPGPNAQRVESYFFARVYDGR
jgi:hypothetical protein